MESDGAVALLIGLCVVAIVVGVAMAASQPPRRPSIGDAISCAGHCASCSSGIVTSCYECGYCARFLPR
jgi:hypothetical protein